MFGLGKKGAEATAFEPWDVLVGLAPSLVEDLAHLLGSTEEDLLVSFQVMPYGDRATLAAYGMIEMDRSSGGRRRVTKVSPRAVELVNLASEFLDAQEERRQGELVDVDAPSLRRAHLLASAAVPWVHVVGGGAITGAPDVGHVVPGTVVAVDVDRVRVRIPLRSPEGDAETDDIQIAPDHEIGGVGTEVVLSYDSADAPLDRPRSLVIDELADA